jgi:hypothetical protein
LCVMNGCSCRSRPGAGASATGSAPDHVERGGRFVAINSARQTLAARSSRAGACRLTADAGTRAPRAAGI